METQLAIIGGGPGGYTAAFLAADLGMQVTLVELQPRLGGVCLLRGCIPSKALLHVARLVTEAKGLADWGVDFAQPAVDLDRLRARKDKIIGTLAAGLDQLAERRRVRVVHARAKFSDSRTLRLDAVGGESLEDNRLGFEHCIVATGSRPSGIAGLSSPSPGVMDSSGALEFSELPESLLVVGGGYIGLELGSVYAALGTRVSVVEMTDGLLPGVDRNLVKPLHKRLSTRFEAIYLNTQLTALVDKGDRIEVTFAGEAEKQVQQFSRVLVSVGRRPNSEGLGLENTKVDVSEQGFLVVDNRQRTADPHVLAIGDVAGQPMLAHKAARQGKVAVEALLGRSVAFEPAAVPAVVFTDPEIAWAGVTETQAQAEGRPVQVAQFPWAASGRAHAVGRTEGLTKWLVDPQTGRLLGCGIVGSGAGELISEAVLAIELGATAGDLGRSIHPHPTLSETLAAAAEVHLGTATDLYRPRRTRQ